MKCAKEMEEERMGAINAQRAMEKRKMKQGQDSKVKKTGKLGKKE